MVDVQRFVLGDHLKQVIVNVAVKMCMCVCMCLIHFERLSHLIFENFIIFVRKR